MVIVITNLSCFGIYKVISKIKINKGHCTKLVLNLVLNLNSIEGSIIIKTRDSYYLNTKFP